MTAGAVRGAAIVGLLVASFGITRGTANLRDRADVDTGRGFSSHASLALSDGYFASGLRLAPSVYERCAAMRFVSNFCNLCKDDADLWAAIARVADGHHCGVLTMAPSVPALTRVKDTGPGSDAQLVFVTMDWVRGEHPMYTRTTILTGPNGRVIWYKTGELQLKDVKIAEEMAANAWR